MLWGMAQITFLFPRLSRQQRNTRVLAWARTLLQRLGVGLDVIGSPPQSGPMLLASNHISWLDIVVLLATCHCRFVSKADVRRWPLIGALASGAGTLYVERASRRDALRVVHHMTQALGEGDILAIFPEGTTGDGGPVLPFHANLLQAAISARAPLQAVALQFFDGQAGTPSRAASYLGDESLLGSIWRTLCARELCAVVAFGKAQLAGGRDRRTWGRDLRAEIEAMRSGLRSAERPVRG